MNTIKHTGNTPAFYTGVVYNDTGKNNYAAMVNGQWIKRKDGRTRWFKYEMEAGRVAYAEAKALLERSKGGNVPGITEDHRFELALALRIVTFCD